jgi:acetyl esterase/lipase
MHLTRRPTLVEVPAVATDLPIVAELLDASLRRPEPAITDVAALRADNPRRLGGPLVRQLLPGATLAPVDADGVHGEWITVPDGLERPVFLYFSGGAYVRGSLRQARGIASTLASLARGRAFSVAYGLAPERPFPAAIEDGLAAYRHLLSLGIPPRDIVFGGDSCGGSLVVSTMLLARDAGLPLPAGSISISPWADLSMSGPSYRENAGKDLASPAFSASAARLYVGNADPRDPLLSPVFADLAGLPPMLILVGAGEYLYSDSAALAEAAARLGVVVELRAYVGMPHVFPMLNLATGTVALREAATFALGCLR